MIARKWESVNAKMELARMDCDVHCLEAVMWYVHHLPEYDVDPDGNMQSHAGRELPLTKRATTQSLRSHKGDDSDPGLATRARQWP